MSNPQSISVPKHVAIIMDGNGRWAKQRFLPRVVGHQRGADAVRRAVKAAGALGIQVLTLYAFSSENWKRSTEEVEDLMGLLRHYLRSEIAELNTQNVCVRFIGERARLSLDVQTLIAQSEALTQKNTGLTLVIALNYGSHAEIVLAVRAIAQEVQKGALSPESIDEQTIAQRLHTHDLPDPDMIIRTSGEQRLSNFLLWQAAYAELVFMDCYWPDFEQRHLEDAVADFSQRSRRFGGR
jgi:undecaprenyl diphosphate synthase